MRERERDRQTERKERGRQGGRRYVNQKKHIVMHISQVAVAHTCNPSYSRGRHQEDCSSSQPGQIVPGDPISKKPYHKK
jgi:hypothetical protein